MRGEGRRVSEGKGKKSKLGRGDPEEGRNKSERSRGGGGGGAGRGSVWEYRPGDERWQKPYQVEDEVTIANIRIEAHITSD